MNTQIVQPENANRLALTSAAPEHMPSGRPVMAAIASALQNFPDGPELWRLYQQQAGLHSENALVECYLPLVGSILNRFAATLPEEVDREDLYSAGLLGLLTALRKFDATTGVPFDSYARQRIRGAMIDEMRRMDWVPRIIREKSRDFQKTTARLEQQLGRVPTKAEAAGALNLTVAKYDELVAEIRPAQFIRLDAPNDNDPESDTSLGEFIAQPDQIDPCERAASSELKQIIFEKLKEMPLIQQQVLTLYFIEGLYLREIASALKLSEGRICQIQTQAIQTLRAYLKRHENGLPALPAKPAGNKNRSVRVQDKSAHSRSKIGSRNNAPII